MKKLIAIIGLVVVAFIAQAQTNQTPVPVHNAETDLGWLIQDIFPNMSKEDYALLVLALHVGARFLRNYKLKGSTKESGLLSNIIAHIAANPLPEPEQTTPTKS